MVNVSLEPLEPWSDNLSEIEALKRSKGGTIVKKTFGMTDVVLSPELLGMPNKYLVRSLAASLTVEIM